MSEGESPPLVPSVDTTNSLIDLLETDLLNANDIDVDSRVDLLCERVRQVIGLDPKEVQKRAWKSFLKGKNLFLQAPTGYGKSLILQALSLLSLTATVLIVAPLKAILDEQVVVLLRVRRIELIK